MSRVPLSDEETRFIFAGEARSNLGDCDPGDQRQIINRLIDIADRQSPPGQLVHEKIQNIDIFTAGDQCRIYTKTVTYVPENEPTYHIIFLLYIDDAHDYEQRVLAEYNQLSQTLLEAATSLDSVTDVEAYLEHHNALSPDDLRSFLD
ncbi:hypothetical protein NDI85_21530 [Halomicroarcula sp. S1AR25-4]|uniref:hypothetical protein n=1 Tax=Haloarcula sp. S1AR25-4 TaxID=2950538 RepID=UPI00287508A5|nr:hypothetical protein [Halomicroarcula sp. S1AR25-4]MDS0280371.1 hypothetical protein [Halomicroarcula sp. S1AR25-4]